MKKNTVCVMVMCVAMSGFSNPPMTITWLDICLRSSEQESERLREDLKDAAKLRECVAKIVYSLNPASFRKVEDFKRKFEVSDEAMRIALIDIIRKPSVRTGWEQFRQGDTQDTRIADRQLSWAAMLLGSCADAEGKRLLMDIATDNTRDSEFRRIAAGSYMGRANTQETQDAIVCFLSDDMRGVLNQYSSVYISAMWAYDKAEGDAKTREAIITAMSTALAKEESKKAFVEGDKLLAERSKEYAESPQRKATLERINKPPDPKTP